MSAEPLLRRLVLDQLAASRSRTRPVDETTLRAARDILADIESRGDAAIREHALRLGDIKPGESEPMVFDRDQLAAARERIPREQRELLERTAARIRAFADAQRSCLSDLKFDIPGGRAGHTCIPVQSAGCYAPGGRYPLPSSVLMTAVTARAAGVENVWVASPRPSDIMLAAAAIAGADGFLGIGGVQAIAALAYGLVGVPECDLIVGPGSRWVTAAKFLVSHRVGIDMLAGPSELLILADETADPALIAADLLAQAEHDDDAVPMLVTTSEPLIRRVEAELASQLASLPTTRTARTALRNGFTVHVGMIAEGIRACDTVAPEHLEVMTRDAASVAGQVRHAGAVFIGSATAEVFGDYGVGPNHVLPTGGTARRTAGLSVFTFLRARTYVRMNADGPTGALVDDVQQLAILESLHGHARSGLRRGGAK